jgi:hypothetical protein
VTRNDPEARAQRAALARAEHEALIAAAVADAPPLPDEVMARLRRLFAQVVVPLELSEVEPESTTEPGHAA